MKYEWLISDLFMGFRFAELASIVIFPMMLIFSCLNLKEIFFKEDRVRDYDFGAV